MDFVFTLHSHLPYVLNHGRWPHGSDWICEAALDTYLPLLEALRGAGGRRVAAPVTIGFTPVLANQLAQPDLRRARWRRSSTSGSRPATRRRRRWPRPATRTCSRWWSSGASGCIRLRGLFHDVDGDLIAAFRALEAAGRIEIIGSAATHGFLPLLARDESIRLQLAVGAAEHRRLFGRAPAGCWLPECAYRPRGPWAPWPTAPRSGVRRGIEEHLADAGFQFFFVDAHLAAAGRPLGLSGDPAALDPEVHQPARRSAAPRPRALALPGLPGRPALAAPVTSRRSCATRARRCRSGAGSRAIPATARYLEFHKMRWPGGLKLWRVSGPSVDLGAKQPYDPALALDRARGHAEHFAGLLGGIAAGPRPAPGRRHRGAVRHRAVRALVVRGPRFPRRRLPRAPRHGRDVRPATGSRPPAPRIRRAPAIRMPAGSWGANGDFSMWLSDQTAWTWERLWPLEERFWDAAPARARPREDDPARPGAGGARAAAGPVLRLAVHHLDRRRGRLRRAAVPGALQRHRGAGRRAGGRLAGGARARPAARGRAGRARRTSSPTCCRRSPPRWAGRARSRSASACRRSASRSVSTSISPSATSITSSRSTCDDVYRPLLDALADREFLPAVLHLSGPLLEWLEAHEPAYLDRLGRLAADGRVELLLAGFYEPVLASLPRTDRVEQIRWMHEAVRRRFGVDARGLWLTERVWEPELAADLADAGVRYALVDDRHFLVTGFAAEQLHAPFWTESDGKRVALFPIDERLRYLIPFRPPEETADYLRELRGAGHRLAVLADDGEKFGGWPGTKEWVYGEGWLDRFIAAIGGLVERGEVVLSRLDDALDAVPSGGLAYLPTASYREMEGWSLPPDAALRLAGSSATWARSGWRAPTARSSAARTGATSWSSTPSRTGCTRR